MVSRYLNSYGSVACAFELIPKQANSVKRDNIRKMAAKLVETRRDI
jgi:hypothetical protein